MTACGESRAWSSSINTENLHSFNFAQLKPVGPGAPWVRCWRRRRLDTEPDTDAAADDDDDAELTRSDVSDLTVVPSLHSSLVSVLVFAAALAVVEVELRRVLCLLGRRLLRLLLLLCLLVPWLLLPPLPLRWSVSVEEDGEDSFPVGPSSDAAAEVFGEEEEDLCDASVWSRA